MSEVSTPSELSQVLSAIQSMQQEITSVRAEIQTMRSEVQAMDKKLDIHIATTAEKFNTLEERLFGEIKAARTELQGEIKAIPTELKALDEKVSDLSDRQRVVDSRLWGFIVALVGAILAYLVKLSFFDKV